VSRDNKSATVSRPVKESMSGIVSREESETCDWIDSQRPSWGIYPRTLPASNPMAPSFSKIPIPAIPSIAVSSGLKCSHEGCYALFSTLADSGEHAMAKHDGKIMAATCKIHNCTLESGEVRLYRVLDETGASAGHISGTLLTCLKTRNLRICSQAPTRRRSP
jgi:hypothetical protein